MAQPLYPEDPEQPEPHVDEAEDKASRAAANVHFSEENFDRRMEAESRICRRRRARRRPAGAPAPKPPLAPALARPSRPSLRRRPLARYVSAQAREFSFTLSRPLVGTGDVTIELQNDGEDPHNLVVSPEGTHDPLLTFLDQEPATVSAATLTLQPGRYYLWCSLEGHEAAGMHASLRVE